MVTKDIKDDFQTTVRLDPNKLKDKRGNKLTLDGVLTFSTDNTDVLTLTPGADGLSCGVAPTGPLGTANLQAAGKLTGGTSFVAAVQFNVVADPDTLMVDLDVDEPTAIPG